MLYSLGPACQALGNSEGGAHSIVSLLRRPVENIQEQALKILVNLLSYRGTFPLFFFLLFLSPFFSYERNTHFLWQSPRKLLWLLFLKISWRPWLTCSSPRNQTFSHKVWPSSLLCLTAMVYPSFLHFSLLSSLTLVLEMSKQVFRESGGVSSLLSIASARSGAHLLALQALAKLAENNGMVFLLFSGIIVLLFLFDFKLKKWRSHYL